jgi:hypothetical protein
MSATWKPGKAYKVGDVVVFPDGEYLVCEGAKRVGSVVTTRLRPLRRTASAKGSRKPRPK